VFALERRRLQLGGAQHGPEAEHRAEGRSDPHEVTRPEVPVPEATRQKPDGDHHHELEPHAGVPPEPVPCTTPRGHPRTSLPFVRTGERLFTGCALSWHA